MKPLASRLMYKKYCIRSNCAGIAILVHVLNSICFFTSLINVLIH